MICRFAIVALLVALVLGFERGASGAAFSLTDGRAIEGEPISFNLQGVVLKLADGTFAQRVGWTNFTQEALKELYKLPKAKSFVSSYEIDERGEIYAFWATSC